jgi:HlyD family secretion protein
MFGKKLIVREPVVAETNWYESLPRSTRIPTIGGVLIMAVAVMGFGVWGNMAPIAGAVVASGVFVATGQNKIIQHLEGGVIRDIYVREGDVVEQDQLLVVLDETAPRADAPPVPPPRTIDGNRCPIAGRNAGAG